MPHLVFVHTKSDVWLLWTKLLGDRRAPLSSERPDYCQYPVVVGVCGANGAGLLDPGGLRQTDPWPLRAQPSPILRAAMKADCGISTLPNWRIRFLPSFCFSRSLRLRVTSPP